MYKLACPRLLYILFLIIFTCSLSYGKAVIDRNVLSTLKRHQLKSNNHRFISLFIFLKSPKYSQKFTKILQQIPTLTFLPLRFMPTAFVVVIPNSFKIVKQLSNSEFVAHISLNNAGSTKEETLESQRSTNIMTSSFPGVDKWWRHGYLGQGGIIGLIDSGVATEHPALKGKQIIKHPDSSGQNTIRSAHGTGVACILAGKESPYFPGLRGIAFHAPTLISTLASVEDASNNDFWLTFTGLNWMLTSYHLKPTVINYSFGNGQVGCKQCPDWSGFSRIVDYIVNKYKILWVTSAGNGGFIAEKQQAPFATTMTIPADNYNGITVANMDMYAFHNGIDQNKDNRKHHAIRYSSSRGPTLLGRRKPDLSAPGNDTRTCAPDPQRYHLEYSKHMDYYNGYRLMGGTSSAAPHVSGAVVLLSDAGIKNPMLIKALLINSADSWTDSHLRGPHHPHYPYQGGHFPVEGSVWNRTYGWGYLNMLTAFQQRDYILKSKLTPKTPIKRYKVLLPKGGKVTLVHERRVGFYNDSISWKLSALSLTLYDATTKKLLASDQSTVDTVHQLANCFTKAKAVSAHCNHYQLEPVIVEVKLNSPIDGQSFEPFALAFSAPATPYLK